MKIGSRFQTRPNSSIHLTIDGESFMAKPGDTVAAALLAHSGDACRITGKGSPRTAFCMMGVCFDCLVEVDGQANIQACMTQVHEGMVVHRPKGFRTLSEDTENA